MKLTGAKIAGFLANPNPSVRVVLIYGPDRGLVRERLNLLTKKIVADPSDPFRIVEFSAADLISDPARLSDEAAAMALTGGQRVVRITDAGDSFTKVLNGFLNSPIGDALILIQAGELGARSTLRNAAEKNDLSASLPCYTDEGLALETVIRETLSNKHGLSIQADALGLLVSSLGGDRALTRQELEKLSLYCGSSDSKTVTSDDVLACIGDSSSTGIENLAYEVCSGNSRASQLNLDRLLGQGQSPIALIRGLVRHFQRLHMASAQVAQGKNPEQAMATLKPPVIYKLQPSFKKQLHNWNDERALQALNLLLQAEIDCKSTGIPDKSILGRLLLQLSRNAARDTARGDASRKVPRGTNRQFR